MIINKAFHIRPISWIIVILFMASQSAMQSQQTSWQLWANGLPAGTFPRMTIAANHDIFYTLVGTASTKGIVYKANTMSSTSAFEPMPILPIPPSIVNNIQCLETNQNSEPIAGIFRNEYSEPWLFRYDSNKKQWIPLTVENSPSLGAYCMAHSPNGTLWVGGKWSYIYKSIDGGKSFQQIDESSIIKAAYPCYYPSWANYQTDGAIYGINVDANGRVYAGTESAGMIYSDDEGISWHPADYHSCQDNNPTQKDSNSTMKPLSMGGNCAGIGFTADNKVIWSGAAMWTLGWNNALGCADMINHTVTQAFGLPQYLVQQGQQISKIVTASNGQVFLHSGGGTKIDGVGIYTSMDGIHWTACNTGINGALDGQSQGSLAVDGNSVFMATHDGKIWKYDASQPNSLNETEQGISPMSISINPSMSELTMKFFLENSDTYTVSIYTLLGQLVTRQFSRNTGLEYQLLQRDVSSLPEGMYSVVLTANNQYFIRPLVILR